LPTEKQLEAQKLRAEGLTYREIGERLATSPQSAHRLANRAARITNRRRAKERIAGLRAEARSRLLEFKAGGCADCGAQLPPVKLGAHHVDPDAKRISVGQFATKLTTRGRLDLLIEELGLCVCLCQRCHSARHKTLRAAA
jgi:hypothetical protein